MLKYWLWLSTRRGLGNQGALAVLEKFGTPEKAYFAEPADYAQLTVVRDKKSLEDKSLDGAERILQACYRKNIHILTWQDAGYPERLRNIDNPPVLLYYSGTIPAVDTEPAIAMVGTRKASAYGLVQAKQLGYQLGRLGAIVVSGAASGIDTLCLKGALTAGRPVIGVLGCGVDVVYPASNRGLFEDIVHNGCLLSEYAPGTPALGEHFPVRNRLISGLCLGVVVVEAPKKSGALITASRALEQGRDVFTLPTNVGSSTGEGNIQLLKEGAQVVENGWDVMREYVHLYPELVHKEPVRFDLTLSQSDEKQALAAEKSGQHVAALVENPEKTDKKDVDKPEARAYIDVQEIFNTLSPDEQAIVQLLQDGPIHIDNVIDQSQLPAGRILASMTLLEVKGYVKRLPGRRFSLAEK